MYFVTSALDQTIISAGDERRQCIRYKTAKEVKFVSLHITKLIYVNAHM